LAVVETARAGGVGIVRLAKPPVNALSAALRRELYAAIDALDQAADVAAIVLHGRGRGFSAGGDIHEFGTPAVKEWPGVSSDLHPRIESCRKPVVAAVHGLCLGGGLETALACHWRVASRHASVGLPEVKVGSLPLSGTQRLPRLVGLQRAAELIGGAQIVPAAELAAAFDQLVDSAEEDAVVQAAIAFAGTLAGRSDRLRQVRQLPPPSEGREHVLAALQEAATPIVRCALQAVLAAADCPDYESGLARARSLYAEVIDSDEARALHRAFQGGTRPA